MTDSPTDWQIVAAAIRVRPDGLIFSLPRPARHHQIIRAMCAIGIDPPIDHARFEQGFIDNRGEFAWRTRAKLIAQDAGQLLPRASQSDELFSEDVW